MTSLILPKKCHQSYPISCILIHYALNLLPQFLHIQYVVDVVCFPLPNAPHNNPMGPHNKNPQQASSALKSFPFVSTSVIGTILSLPHL